MIPLKLVVNGTATSSKRAVRAIAFYKDKLLLMHLGTSDTYVLPGGSLEPDESLEEGLRREMLEETGHEIRSCVQTLNILENLEGFDREHYFYRVELGEKIADTTMTKEETALNMSCRYLKPEKALELMSMHQGTHHLSEFVQLRELIGIVHSVSLGGAQ